MADGTSLLLRPPAFNSKVSRRAPPEITIACNRPATVPLISFDDHGKSQPQEHGYEMDGGAGFDDLTRNGRCLRPGLAPVARPESRRQSGGLQGSQDLAQGTDPEVEGHGRRGCR